MNKSREANFWPAPVGESFGVKELAANSLKLASHSSLIFERSLIVTAEVPVVREHAKALLPYGLWLPKNPTALLFAADHRKPCFTRHYQEVSLMLRVNSVAGSGLLVAWMLVNDDSALIYGREVLGYPKKMAEISIKEIDGRVEVRASRRDGEIFRLDVTRGAAEATPPPLFATNLIAVGGLGQLFALNAAWACRSSETVHQSHVGDATYELGKSAYDPIAPIVSSGAKAIARITELDVGAGRLILPVGIAGLRFFAKNYNLRFR